MATSKAGREDHLAISQIDRLIHEPSRFIIMAHLYVVESADFLFLMRPTGLTWGNLSSHLSKLEAAGYLVQLVEAIDTRVGSGFSFIIKQKVQPNASILCEMSPAGINIRPH